MSTWNEGVYTQKGLALLAKLTQGTSLNITRAVAGTGKVSDTSLNIQTAVTNPKQELTFQTAYYPEVGTCKLPMYLTNDGVTATYNIHQIGLYATDPDEGEILYFIAQSTNGTEIPAFDLAPGFTATWTFYFKYGQANDVNVTVNPNNAVTPDMLEEVKKLAGAGASEAKQGERLAIDKTAELPFAELKIYGKSTQEDVPNSNTPVEITNLGESGAVSVCVTGQNLVDLNLATFNGCGLENAETGSVRANLENQYYCSIYLNHLCDFILGNQNKPYTFSLADRKERYITVVIGGERTDGAPYQEFIEFNKNYVTCVPTDFVSVNRVELRVGRSNSTYTDQSTIYSQIQFTIGDKALGFEPAKNTQIIKIQTPNELCGVPVVSGGNYTDLTGQQWICDEIDLTKGMYIQRLNKVTVDSSYSFVRQQIQDTYYRFDARLADNPNLVAGLSGVGLSTHFTANINVLSKDASDNEFTAYESGGLYFRCDKFASVEELTNYLTENPIEFVYPRATPIETPLSANEITACKALIANNPTTVVINTEGAEMLVDCVTAVYEPAFEMVLRNAGGAGSCTLTHSKSGTVHAFTGLSGSGLVSANFLATASYTAGDTATIDGTEYTFVLTGADEPDTDLFVSGRAVSVVVDTESKTVNFKSGGGLSNGKLALATATEGTVLLGYSFYAGDKTLKEGTYDPDWAIKKYW